MAGYITCDELKDIADTDKLEGKSETSLQLLITSSKELIDKYCKKEFTSSVPSIVKVVSSELVVMMLQDNTIESETEGKYSYKVNKDAYNQILTKLDNFVEETYTPKNKTVRMSLL